MKPISTLLVEDDKATRKLLYSLLTQQYPDVVIRCAENGAEGLQLFKEHRPDIVITDIAMPIMDGLLMAVAIRSLEPEAVIIAVTSYSDSASLLKAINIGINHYVIKPFDTGILFREIDKHISTISMKHQLRAQNDRIRRLSMIAEQSPVCVVVTDAEGVIEHVNARFTDFSGYSPVEMIGQNLDRLISGSETTDAYEELWRTAASGGAWRGELQGIKKSKEKYWVSIAASPLKDDDGTFHYILMSQDITADKLAEKERESTIEFLRIVNACTELRDMIPAAMHFFAVQSRCSGVGVRLRKGDDYPYYAVQGFPLEFMLTENLLCKRDADGKIILDGSGNPELECMCGNVISGRADPSKPFFTTQGSFWTNSTTELLATMSVTERQSNLRNRCNSAGFQSLALIPLVVGKERLGLLQLIDARKGAFSPGDISLWERMAGYLAIALIKFRSDEALKKLNEELDGQVQERTRRLEMALREQESFSYSVSHDLRAPLRHINSYLAILSEDFGNLLPTEAHNFLDRSRTASRQMGKLIDGLLELSRISRTNLTRETVDLSEMAAEVCARLKETGLDRQVEFAIDADLSASCDKTLLIQVLENLLGNAWKYTSANRKAKIEFGKNVVGELDIFYVKDNGIGFDMAYKDKLFGAFERLHGLEYEGNGIGLATVKRIIERHGGEIWADSEINEGATFHFKL